MTKTDVDAWLRHYIDAWQSYEPGDITALFTDDVEYRYHPWDEPVIGSGRIADSWVEADRKDDPDSWEAQYTCIAVDGDVAIATGYSRYLTTDGLDPNDLRQLLRDAIRRRRPVRLFYRVLHGTAGVTEE